MYTAAKVFFITRQVELARKKKFTTTALGPEDETFVIYVASLVVSNINQTYLFYKAQIALLKVDKAPTTISLEYFDFADVFSLEQVVDLSEYMGFQNQAIDLVDYKQPSYGSMYSLERVELEILKAYIKTYLTNSFIKSFKSPTVILIFCY